MAIYKFNVEEVTQNLILWLRRYFFEGDGRGCHAVIGISGGKDSTILAKLLVEAIGKQRVYGLLMPNGIQNDIEDARAVVKYLDIQNWEVNIANTVESFSKTIGALKICNDGLSNQAAVNLPARVRMVMLYAFAQQWGNCRVMNTCNLSEDTVGYATRYGDGAGDIAPLSQLTVTEIKAIGHYLGIPRQFVEKIPSDGLCGKTDEDILRFSYDMLDKFIRTCFIESKSTPEEWEAYTRICDMYKKNKFKLEPMPSFNPGFWNNIAIVSEVN